MSRKGGLGKGLDVLIPKGKMANLSVPNSNSKEEIKVGTQMLKLTEIEPNRDQPRKKFEEGAIEELAQSIKDYGVIQPIVVCKKDDHYEIVTGERRWRAAKKAGLKEIPVVLREYSKQEVMAISLIENIQREDLNPIEEAIAYQRLIDELSITQEEVAKMVAKSRTTVTNTLRLLKLIPEVRQMLIDEEITGGHARALLALEDVSNQKKVAQSIVSNNLSVRETEQLIKQLNDKESKKEEKTKEKEQDTYVELEEKLQSIIGTKVHIKNKKGNKGKIEIEYYTIDDFERIIDLLNRK
ncbi:Chromosome (plasmid) partitioning protein ParB / Stage 0 sporulation protein J [Lachnospiraceae bacterium TWA4]|nr:Chromosome (plasmid) partitioning protein ParB / Stage 0 sporulation protein J [Lachnospiraceae bacterium TWA4]